MTGEVFDYLSRCSEIHSKYKFVRTRMGVLLCEWDVLGAFREVVWAGWWVSSDCLVIVHCNETLLRSWMKIYLFRFIWTCEFWPEGVPSQSPNNSVPGKTQNDHDAIIVRQFSFEEIYFKTQLFIRRWGGCVQVTSWTSAIKRMIKCLRVLSDEIVLAIIEISHYFEVLVGGTVLWKYEETVPSHLFESS